MNYQALVVTGFLFLSLSCAPSPDENLLAAAKAGDAAGVKAALAQGADVNARDKDNNPPLYLAAQKGDLPSVKILVEANADMNASGKSTLTALHVACQKGDFEMAKYLVVQGANINARTSLGWTPLSIAMLNSHRELAVLLRQDGAEATEAIEKDEKQKFFLDRMVEQQMELSKKKATRPPDPQR